MPKLQWQTIQQYLLWAALLVMILHVVIYVTFGIAVIPFPFDYDQAEGYELNNAILLSQGGCPYCDNDVFPFYGSGYPPVFHMLMVPFVWLFGANYWYGRLIIFASTLVTAGAIAWAAHHTEKHRWVAILAGCSFLASNYIYHIGPLLRQHLLMVMFETLAVIIVSTAFSLPEKQKRRRLFIGFALLLIAGFTKQLAYSTCIAVAIWVFLQSPRLAIRYSLGVIVAAGIVFAGWMVFTQGYFFDNIITSNQNPYITEQFVGLTRQFITLHYPLLILAILMIIYELYFARISIYVIWWVAAALNTLSAGKWGAGDSYYDTLLVATCILAGIFLARTLNKSWTFPNNYIQQRLWNLGTTLQGYIPIVGVLVLCLFLLYGYNVRKLPTSGIFESIAQALNIEPLPAWRYPLHDPAGWTVGYAVTGHFPSEGDYVNGERIRVRAASAEGYVMSEDASFSIQNGLEVITNGVQLKNLWENGLYDPTNLVNMISNHEFGLIIIRAELFPPPILEAIKTFYVIDEIIPMNGFEYELWVPNTSNT